MRRSTDRVLTTHTGSLQRPARLLEMIQARDQGAAVDEAAFAAAKREAVADVVRKQAAVGIDVVNDGELGKPSFASYVTQRIGGFSGHNPEYRPFADRAQFPEWAADNPPGSMTRRYCTGDLVWRGDADVAADVGNLKAALADTTAVEAFLPAASLGIVADIMLNRHYPTEQAYLYALADAMRHEYRAITEAGLVLQIDAPDAAMGRHMDYPHLSVAEFRRILAGRVEALNHALEGIPEEQIRYHICWGNYEGPHTNDVALDDVVDLMLAVRAGAYSVEAANPRHAHEWRVWERVKLPEGKLLIPGVIDSTTNFVEHPEVVAERIERFAGLVGRENVIAGTDCGFGTTAGRRRVYESIMWEKFGSLVAGARLASERLWR
ncbi:MAG: cobalamin-independent methionine synthase II family protein [Chloroflexota bacterium]